MLTIRHRPIRFGKRIPGTGRGIKHGTSDAADYRSGAADAKECGIDGQKRTIAYCGIGMQTI